MEERITSGSCATTSKRGEFCLTTKKGQEEIRQDNLFFNVVYVDYVVHGTQQSLCDLDQCADLTLVTLNCEYVEFDPT